MFTFLWGSVWGPFIFKTSLIYKYYTWVTYNRNYYDNLNFERLFFLTGFVAHDPMVRKLPTRRFVDYPQKNRYQVTM